MTDDRTSLLSIILHKLSPADIHLKENRALVTERIEKMLYENGWSRRHFSVLMRRETVHLRIWLSHTYNLTAESLGEICGLLDIPLRDLIAE